MKKLILMIILTITLSGCLTKTGDMLMFETLTKSAEWYMTLFLRNHKDELKYPDEDFIKSTSWSYCLEANNIEYKLEFTLPKLPQETIEDGYADCVNLSILSVWNYGYENVKYWVIMSNRDNEMHQIVIYNDNRVISSRSSRFINSYQEFEEYFDEYDFFNFYSADFDNELKRKDIEF